MADKNSKNKDTGNSVMPNATPDYWRQLDVFDPEAFIEDIHIIGVGATGSWIAYLLAKMGVKKIHAYDFDVVEAHNLPNQIYGRQDVGKYKVDALQERLANDCGTVVVAHNEQVDGTQKLQGIVFLCTDTMSSRTAIWKGSLKLKLSVKLLVETRMAAEFGIVHIVRPTNAVDIKGFENSLSTDEEAEESPCSYRAIATTVTAIASLAAHKVIKFAKYEEMEQVVIVKEGEQHSEGDMFCIRPLIITTTDWNNYSM